MFLEKGYPRTNENTIHTKSTDCLQHNIEFNNKHPDAKILKFILITTLININFNPSLSPQSLYNGRFK
jgi:hypothetical protein